jgi:fatty-acyl-CoA synthase
MQGEERLMLEGLVQHDHPLTTQMLLARMRTVHGRSRVTTLREPGDPARLDSASYAEVADRVDQLAAGLRSLGIGDGDRVATFMWNSQEHLEAYLAIPSMGAVLHTINVRLFSEQLVYIVQHAQDRIIMVDDSLVGLLAPHVASFAGVEHFIVVGDGEATGLPAEKVIRYEELLAAQEPGFDYPVLDDHQASGLCYTSGTTGNPKGVLYSHKSTFLHAMAECMADGFALTSRDIVLPIVPMFHAQAWGLPYSCTLAGADLVMPSRFLQGEPLIKLVVQTGCTVAAAVPTIWFDALRYADEHHPDLSKLRLVPCGGSAVPSTLMRGFEERHGVSILQCWGMTETSPLGSVARPPRGVEGEDAWAYRTIAGRVTAGVEARLVDDDGQIAPWDGETPGELEVRGPWVASAYYEDDRSSERFRDGWLRTGDIATIDDQGYIRLVDRAKDMIKSGGEWISSVDLEAAILEYPAVREVAVIARPDDRYDERPLACVVLEDGVAPDADALAGFLRERVARFWVPEEFAFVDEVPKTSVGKFDKKVLRARLAAGELSGRRRVGQVGAGAD